MTELLTAAQMRAVEAAAISSGQVTGLELMERAGRGVVEAIFEEWPDLRATPQRAVVLCGPGNNGGDGFVVARLFKEWGWAVEVFLYGDAAKLPPDARVNYERWCGIGAVVPWSNTLSTRARLDCDVIIDAVFGTGLTRAIKGGDGLSVILPAQSCPIGPGRPVVVAVDVPSGLCADSGSVLQGSDVFWADLTVSFHRAKIGQFLNSAERLCSKVVVVDIGLEAAPTPGGDNRRQTGLAREHALDDGQAPVQRVTAPREDLAKGRPHKFSHGHALIVAGGIASGGAARLAARGALRIGAGVVTLGCPPSAVMVNAGHLNAIMLKPISDAAALVEVLEDVRINALCLGPGMGTTVRQAELLAAVLDPGRSAPRPTVLDADALTLLAGDADLFAMLHQNCVLTPHAGEFARLFPDISARLNEPAIKGPAYSRVDATREAAKRAGCAVLFKGADTVIAGPDGRCSINAAVYDRAAPWLATAGSGDVLAGFITGLLARGFDPMQAAETAAWLHVDCALSFGPGLIAEDLPEELPKVFRGLGL